MPVRKEPRTLVRGEHVVTTRVPAEVTRLKARGYRDADGGPKAEAVESDVSGGPDKPDTPEADAKTSETKSSDAKPEKAKANESKPSEAKAAK